MIKDFLISLIQQYGNIAIFISLFLEYLGAPFPGETMMCFLGFLNWKSGGSSVYFALIYSVAGTFIGSSLAWFIGYKYGESVVLKYGRFAHITKERLDSTEKLFTRYKGLLLLFGRYVPGVRHIVPYLSGMSRLNFGVFTVYNLVGSIIWCVSFIGIGFLLGEKWLVAEKLIKAYSLALILLIAFVFVVFKFFNRHKKLIFAIAFPVLIFIKLVEDIIKDETSVFDSRIYNYLTRYISHNMTDLMKFLSILGAGQTLVVIAVIGIIAFWKKGKYSFYSIMIAVNWGAVSILNEAFKVIFHRERPDILRLVEVTGFSFPSGHSMVGLSFYGLIAYLFYTNMKSRWKYPILVLFSVLIGSIGISRIYLGVHYASDVLAGFSAGLAWLAVFITLMNRIYFLRTAKKVEK